jgi:ABC-type nitrate/sulfonate/bicarbonate transport system permease component
MSRAHDRAYQLLAERVRWRDGPRRALYAVLVVLAGSGAWWLIAHYAMADDLARLPQEALALKVHGAAAFAMLVAAGAISANHVRRGWSLARNRASGSVVITLFALLIATGYALYYLVDDATRPPVSLSHWIAGLALVPLIAIHIVAGRRSRNGNAKSRG